MGDLRRNWGVTGECSGDPGDSGERARSGCYYEHDPDDSDDAAAISNLKLLTSDEPGTLSEHDQWRRDRLTTKVVHLAIEQTLDCSLSKSDFRRRYGDLGGAVNETRRCDPATVGIPGTAGAHLSKPVAGASGKPKGSPGGAGDTGAIRAPAGYVPKPADGQSSKDGGIEPGAEPDSGEVPEEGAPGEAPPADPSEQPDDGTAEESPSEQQDGSATEGGTGEPAAEPPAEPERSAEEKFNDQYDSDGDGCLSGAEYGGAIDGILDSSWNDISQPDAFRDAHNRRC